jgi:hypothetical protein
MWTDDVNFWSSGRKRGLGVFQRAFITQTPSVWAAQVKTICNLVLLLTVQVNYLTCIATIVSWVQFSAITFTIFAIVAIFGMVTVFVFFNFGSGILDAFVYWICVVRRVFNYSDRRLAPIEHELVIVCIVIDFENVCLHNLFEQQNPVLALVADSTRQLYDFSEPNSIGSLCVGLDSLREL